MTLRVFVSGQSNTVGRGTGGPDWAGVDSRVRVWDNANPLGANGTAWRTAAVARSTYGTFENTDRNNFAVWFCHKLAQTLNEDVDMTMVARGGTAISGWAPAGSPPMLQECIDVWAATGQAPAHVFLWHQGEGNVTSPDAAGYKSAFLALVANLKAASVIDDDTIIIVGGTAEENADRINFNITRLQALAAENDAIQYAPSDGLPTSDGTHFTGSALYSFGVQSYFAAYLQAEGLGMTDIWTLVNEGGTPGVSPSGTQKIFNLKSLRAIGLGVKDTTLAPDYAGIPPGDNLLTAAMVAGGAVVEIATSPTEGTVIRFESGLQIAWARKTMTWSSSSLLFVTWTFPKAFSGTNYAVTAIPNLSIASTGWSGAKRGGTVIDCNSFTSSTAGNIRAESNALYTDGTEQLGVMAIAVGMWK
jgi:hypothetical protein